MKVQIIDYGMGNLGSVKTAVGLLGFTADIISMSNSIESADKIILPGVGSFSNAMTELLDGSWIDAIREQVIDKQKPILGICLGMQLLASKGEEGGITDGLDLISGEVKHLRDLGCNFKYNISYKIEDWINEIKRYIKIIFLNFISYREFTKDKPQDC